MSKSKTSKISTLGSQITSVVSVSLVLFVLGLLAVLLLAAGRVSTGIMGDITAVVKLEQGISEDQAHKIGDFLESMPYTTEALFTSADEVLEQEMEYNAEVLDLLDENPYAHEYELRLHPSFVQPDSIEKISSELMLVPGIDEVVTQLDMVKSVSNATGRVSLVLGVVAALLLVISLVLIFNTVSIGVYGRRFVIRTMQLVGATGAFIRRPFVMAGIWAGIISGLLASLMLVGAQAYVNQLGMEFYLVLPVSTLLAICGALIGIGVLICGSAAWLATNRYLRASYDFLYS